MQIIGYILFRLVVALFSILPFRVIYGLSDLLRFLFFRVFKYRYRVIKENLQNAFPEKTDFEIKDLVKKTYQNLCDVLLEGIVGFSMSDEQILKRYKILNPEVADQFFTQRKNLIGVCSHYSNWEWAAHALSLQLKHQSVALASKVKNSYLDKYIQKSRSHKKMQIIHAADAGKLMKNWIGDPALFIFIADQSPPKVGLKKAHWVNFLNQETAFLNGAERMARWRNFPIIHMMSKRVKRGFYEVTFEIISEHPIENKKGSITEKYAKELEQQILNHPPDWLWSHRRWKHKRNVN